MLRPPVEPMLAQARVTLPGPGVLPGGLAFEARFDGYRCLLSIPARSGAPVLLRSRRGSLIQAHFPDLVSAAAQLSRGLVLDDEGSWRAKRQSASLPLDRHWPVHSSALAVPCWPADIKLRLPATRRTPKPQHNVTNGYVNAVAKLASSC